MSRVPAPAKINLYLHVGGKRADGYHALESLVCFAETGDVLEFEIADRLTFAINGPFAEGLSSGNDNLILRAAAALAAYAGPASGAAIILTKNLPLASGIGGGSADAAAALRGLVKLWDIGIGDAALNEIALSLGSDVPVCVKSVPAIMTGRGEGLRAIGALPAMAMLLVNPRVGVSTGEVFRRLGRTQADVLPPAPPLPAPITTDMLLAHLAATRNDMEAPAIEIAPVIGEVLSVLRRSGALLARMSGSGATCFALYDSDAAAEKAAQAVRTSHPQWWVQPTRIARPDIAG
jgi:4-diphosphocytidyl-2-C-methyl-D-erythritol kinase